LNRDQGENTSGAMEGEHSHSLSPQSSTIRISTPSLDPADELIVENWIQHGLAIPSATNTNDANTDTDTDRNNNDGNGEGQSSKRGDDTNHTTNLCHHRRERSLGSEISLEGDLCSFGIYDNLPNVAAAAAAAVTTSTFISNNCPVNDSSENDLATEIGTAHSTKYDDNDNVIDPREFSSHPLLQPNSKLDWGSDSCINMSFSFNSSIVPTPLMTTSSSGDSCDNDLISSVIHDAARITDWETVAELCKKKPKNAEFIGRDGWTALHHACNRRCPYPNAVESLIRSFPDALLITEEKGWLPLHYACRFKAPKEVVRLLLQIYPEKGRIGVSRPDRKGRSPLYYAVRYDAPDGVVELLLEVDASAVLEEDRNADSPLALVWDDWAEKLDGKRTIQQILSGDTDYNTNIYQDSIHSMMNNSMGIFFDLTATAGNSNNDNGKDIIEVATRIKRDLFEKAKMVRKRLEIQTSVCDRWNKVNKFLKAAFGFGLNEEAESTTDYRYYLEENKRENSFFNDGSKQCNAADHTRRTWRILHAISAIKCHYSLFLLAISLHPEQAFELDRDDLRRINNIYKSKDSSRSSPSDLTALHLAASSHASGESGRMVLSQLLALNPDAVHSVDTEGSTPLHRIAENNCKADWNIDGVDEVHLANNNAIMAIDVNGRLPLHRASSVIECYETNVEDDIVLSRSVLCRLLQANVETARCTDYFGCLPLHLVAQHGMRWDVQMQTLYDANTSAVLARTGVKFLNRLPIHLASMNFKSDVSMITKLIEYNPRGTSQADRKGSLPLHLACESGLPWKCVQVIHEAFPEAVRQTEQNSRGWNALHMAAFSERSDKLLISNVIQLHPESASVKDSDDRYPLHLACMSGHTWDGGISSIFETNADAIRSRDKDGLLPLHITAFRCCTKSKGECKGTGIRNCHLSKSGSTLEADELITDEKKTTQELSNIFELLKADPTVLLYNTSV